MKCKRCRAASAAVDLPSHNAAFCPECFFVFFQRMATEGIKAFRMFGKEDRVLVCVSGGKDSLVLWDLLLDLGYDAEALYIDLAIPGYSDRSREKVLKYAATRGKTPIIVSLADEGVPIAEAAKAARKPECGICGTVKRYFFNKVAKDGGFTVVATGHNLDDEAGRLLGNLLHWDDGHLAKQHPFLPETGDGMVRKVKPLWRVSELETASYGFLKGIDYVTEECPMSLHATSLVYKEALNVIEEKMPGTRLRFYQEFARVRHGLFEVPEREGWGGGAEDDVACAQVAEGGTETVPSCDMADGPVIGASTEENRRCSVCGTPSFVPVCGYCRLKEKVAAKRVEREAKGAV